MNGPAMYLFEVAHPDFPTAKVVSIKPDSAIYAAIGRWGADWRKEAGYCTVRNCGKATRPRCSRCGREFGQLGQTVGKCPECLRTDELYRRRMATLPKSDRRPGMRGR